MVFLAQIWSLKLKLKIVFNLDLFECHFFFSTIIVVLVHHFPQTSRESLLSEFKVHPADTMAFKKAVAGFLNGLASAAVCFK